MDFPLFPCVFLMLADLEAFSPSLLLAHSFCPDLWVFSFVDTCLAFHISVSSSGPVAIVPHMSISAQDWGWSEL